MVRNKLSMLEKVAVMREEREFYYIDAFGLLAIGIFSLGYVLWGSTFAEINLQFKGLDFPIFLGEILLFLCGIAYLYKLIRCRFLLTPFSFALLAYCLFVLVKALEGYYHTGPLALRHSALFYYPLFILLGYSFYRRDFFDTAKQEIILLILLSILFSRSFYEPWILTIILLSYGSLYWLTWPKRYKLIIILLLIIFTPYWMIFKASRMVLVSNIMTVGFVVPSLFYMLRGKKLVKVTSAALVLIVFLCLVFIFGDKNSLRSMYDIEYVLNQYKTFSKEIQSRKRGYARTEKTPRVYNPNGTLQSFFQNNTAKHPLTSAEVNAPEDSPGIPTLQGGSVSKISGITPAEVSAHGTMFAKPETHEDSPGIPTLQGGSVSKISGITPAEVSAHGTMFAKPETHEDSPGIPTLQGGRVSKIQSEESQQQTNKKSAQIFAPQKDERNMDIVVSNALFRIFIWEDMIKELLKEKKVFGFSFGWPLRSLNLEVLQWGAGEWSRDGWICAHNSYLHIIYRSGVLGFVFIGFILSMLFNMIKTTLRNKSLIGILLCGIIINWFVAANFLQIFELPYTAIPIWTLFGLALAYLHTKNGKNHLFAK